MLRYPREYLQQCHGEPDYRCAYKRYQRKECHCNAPEYRGRNSENEKPYAAKYALNQRYKQLAVYDSVEYVIELPEYHFLIGLFEWQNPFYFFKKMSAIFEKIEHDKDNNKKI